jgi:hypothetical protein
MISLNFNPEGARRAGLRLKMNALKDPSYTAKKE